MQILIVKENHCIDVHPKGQKARQMQGIWSALISIPTFLAMSNIVCEHHAYNNKKCLKSKKKGQWT